MCLLFQLFLFFSRLTPDSPRIPLRLFLSNESGYSLESHTYQEVIDPTTGHLAFKSWGRGWESIMDYQLIHLMLQKNLILFVKQLEIFQSYQERVLPQEVLNLYVI